MTDRTNTKARRAGACRISCSVIVAAGVAAAIWVPGLAHAQTTPPPATSPTDRAQSAQDAAPAPKSPPGPAASIGVPIEEQGVDFRKAMRRLVEDVAIYARSLKRDFIVLSRNGLDLLVEPDVFDDTMYSLSGRYVRSIDGVLIDALYFGQPKQRKLQLGVATNPRWREQQLKKLKKAEAGGLIGFALDFSTKPADIDKAWRSARKDGLVSYTAPGIGIEMNRLPKSPARPYAENPRSVRYLQDVKNFLFLRNSSAFGPQVQLTSQLARTNYDMLIVDAFHKRKEPLTRETVAALKFKKLGSRRLVLAYLNIGEASDDRYYWQRDWQTGIPAWIGPRQRHNSDRYYVRYWVPEWNAIIYGSRSSYLYGLIHDLGFDGVLLDGLDAFRHYEGSLE